MIALSLDHLWQSTVFAAGVGLLTLVLRDNSARLRFWLWFAASLKFLIPFTVLTAFGSYFRSPVTVPALYMPAVSFLQPAMQPFSTSATTLIAHPAKEAHLIPVLFLLWVGGCSVILVQWFVSWMRLRRILGSAVELPLNGPLPVKEATSLLEPGLVGILRPVILLPRGIANRLKASELDSVIAHELCHWRRGDNLLATAHMLVEVLFWFHPLIWWLGARLNTERERACDESVLASGKSPQVYAEAILKICKLYLHSPLACASGMSGTDLKHRVKTIMESRPAVRLNTARVLLLGASAVSTLAVPFALGLAKSSLAQTQSEAPPSPTLTAERRSEQALPRIVVPFNPAHFDKYVGYYELGPSSIFTITRDGQHLLTRLTGQVSVEVFPESETKYFATVVHAQITFGTDTRGKVTELVLHQNGLEQHAPRVSESVAKSIEAALAQRVKNNTPSPGTERALRHEIDSEMKGQPDYSNMMPGLAAGTKEQWPVAQQLLNGLGALKSVTFNGVGPGGADIYEVVFERAQTEWRIQPLSPDGKIFGLGWRRLP